MANKTLKINDAGTGYGWVLQDEAGTNALTLDSTGVIAHKPLKLSSANLTATVDLEPTLNDRRVRFVNPSGQASGGFEFFASDALYAKRRLVLRNDGKNGFNTDDPKRELHITGQVAIGDVGSTLPDNTWSTYLEGGAGSSPGVVYFSDDPAGGGNIFAASHASNVGTSCGEFTGYRARGTHAAPLTCTAGDELVKYAGVGRTVGTFQQGAWWQIECDDGWGDTPTDSPGRHIWATCEPDTGTIRRCLMLDSGQRLVLADDTVEAVNRTGAAPGDFVMKANKYLRWDLGLGAAVAGIGFNSATRRLELNANSEFLVILNASTATTVGAAGAAAALPSAPDGYLRVQVGGSERVIPYYNT